MLLVMLSSTDCLCVFNLLTYYCNSQVLYFIFKTTRSFYHGPRNIMNIPCTKCFQYVFVFLHFLMLKSLKSFLQIVFVFCVNICIFINLSLSLIFIVLRFLFLNTLRKNIPNCETKKAPLSSFPPVTTKNVGIRPKMFLTFSFNPFATLVQSFMFVPSVNHKSLNLNKDHSSEKVVFQVKFL